MNPIPVDSRGPFNTSAGHHITMTDLGFQFDTTYATLPPTFYTEGAPAPAHNPGIVVVNQALADEMGLDLSSLDPNAQAQLFSGNVLPPGAAPFSQAYAGHQFGNFTLLGDGRAHMWGEHVTPKGQRLDIQFKGSGRTPYSRQGDGKAALGPMLREYIVSEGMHHLGIPTTRSLAVVTTGQPVIREALLKGAILTRVASSHIRVGTFQFAAYQRDKDALTALLDYTIARHYPDLAEAPNKAVALIEAVMEKQVDLIVHWMRVGFIHGVMNTDNMTLSGETIDYGPCAFMDAYDPATVFSSIDHMGRYAYGNQPRIAQWNIARLAETLLPLIDADEDKAVDLAETAINQFPELYFAKWRAMMRAKLGLIGEQDGDEALGLDLLKWMQTNTADFTNTFRDLSQETKPTAPLYGQAGFAEWHGRWQARRAQNDVPEADSLALMRASNPAIIPRNHIVEHALTAAEEEGDLAPLMALLSVLQSPYQDQDAVGGVSPYQSLPDPGERVYQTFCGT